MPEKHDDLSSEIEEAFRKTEVMRASGMYSAYKLFAQGYRMGWAAAFNQRLMERRINQRGAIRELHDDIKHLLAEL